MTRTQFRPFLLADVPVIHRIYLQNPAEIDPTYLRQEMWLQSMTNANQTERTEVVCPRSAIFPRGLVSVWQDGVAAAVTLFLDEAVRRQGIGTQMVRRAEQMARELPFKPRCLNAHVYRGNHASYRLFLKTWGPPTCMANATRWDGQYLFQKLLDEA